MARRWRVGVAVSSSSTSLANIPMLRHRQGEFLLDRTFALIDGAHILEADALENAGRRPAQVYRECVLYTTLSPCSMCSGAILLYGISARDCGREPDVHARRRAATAARR